MISVVIPNWNGAEFLPRCLEALRRQGRPADTLIVVDNGSEDGSLQLLQRDYPEVAVVELPYNHGFAGGVNRGIEAAISADADYIALLNNDAEPEPQWLESLLQTLEQHPEAGVTAAKQVDYEGRLDSTGEEYSIWGTPFSRGRGEVDRGQYDSDTRIFAASGAASLYRRELFEDVGLFDEWMFAYYEDVDLSFRARLRGWEVRYEPAAIVRHAVGATSDQLGDFRLHHIYKNFPVLFIKNMPGKLFVKYGWRAAGVMDVKNSQLLKHLKLRVFVTLWWSLGRHAPALWGERRRIQRHRTVSTEYIEELLYHAPPPEHGALTELTRKLPFN